MLFKPIQCSYPRHYVVKAKDPCWSTIMDRIQWTVCTVEVVLDIANKCGEKDAVRALHTFVNDRDVDEKFVRYYLATRSSPVDTTYPSADPILTKMYGELVSTFVKACS